MSEVDENLSTFLAHHAVVPAAVIAMVASLLSYLVDVRSAFLGGGPQLKWIGFCFAVATVLIERYRRVSGDTDTQGCYTAVLGVATVSVMLIVPVSIETCAAMQRRRRASSGGAPAAVAARRNASISAPVSPRPP